MSIASAYTIGTLSMMGISATVPISPNGVANLVIYRQGEVVYNYTSENLLTTIGSTHIRDVIGEASGSPNATKWISLSTDATPLISWTKLPNEIVNFGLIRKLATYSAINATCYQQQTTFTATGEQAGIIAMGLNWGPSGDNNLFAAAAISSASVIKDDTILGTWQVNTPPG